MSNEQQGDQNEDKKVIEEEEREKMLNAQNKKKEAEEGGAEAEAAREAEKKDEANGVHDSTNGEGRPVAGEVERKRRALEEASQDAKARGRIPTGGIRMPGFLRPRSRDKAKDGELDLEEGADLLKDGGKSGDGSGDKSSPAGGGLRSLLPRFPALPALSALPSVRLSIPFTKRFKSKDVEAGQDATDTTQAGLASMETLEDGTAKENGEDGMENIKLDTDEKTEAGNGTTANGGNVEANQDQEKKPLVERIRSFKHKSLLGGLLLLLIVIVIIVITAIATPKHVPEPAAIVDDSFILTHTSCGKVEGLREDSAYSFRGIPFARPPIGDLRWKPAQELENISYCWNGTLKAHNSSRPCWQMYPDGAIDGVEDCLTLDIFTPKVDFDLPLPVVVVVGSTHLIGGSTQMLMMPSAKLATAKEAVFVRVNFRLGVLGFLAGSALSRSVHPKTSGNYGLSDILVALKWVNLNIDKFGGDKEQVTVLGYRAGATLVTALATSPKVKGLMKRAWVTSGSADFPGRTLAEVESEYQPFIDSLCPDVVATSDPVAKDNAQAECLRKLDVEMLLEKIPAEWRPRTPELPMPLVQTTDAGNQNRTLEANKEHQWLVVDGDILREHPASVIERWTQDSSSTPPVEIVLGATAHADATIGLYKSVAGDEVEAVKEKVRASILTNLELADEALRRYNSTWLGLARLVSDLRTVCPLNALFVKMPPVSTHFYVVTFPYSVNTTNEDSRYPGPLAELGIDVAAIMGRIEASTPEQRRYLVAITQLFFNFTRGKELHHSADSTRGKILNVGQDTNRVHEYPHCNFWIKNDAAPHYGHRN